MTSQDFLKQIDYHNCDIEGQLYEELGISNLSDILDLYFKLKTDLIDEHEKQNTKRIKKQLFHY